MSDRMKKVNSLSQRVIAQILEKDIDLPPAQKFLFSVTDVNVDSDLHNAEVYISILGDKEKSEEAFALLTRRLHKIQFLYGQKIRLKFTPKLHLKMDTTAAYASKIDALIKEIHKNDVR